jgi:Domain of unknown function (DUF4336)
MLEQFGADIWISDGGNVQAFGFHYPTRMAVLRLVNGDLFIWSPTPISDGLKAEVDRLGPVRHIVAPNSLHHLSLLDWRGAYPNAKLYAPPKLRDKRTDIEFDDDLGDAPSVDWAGEIEQVVVQGNLITTEVVFFHVKSGTVLFTDLIQQFPDDWFSGWRRFIAKLDLMVGSEPSVPRKFRVAFTDRKAARASIGRVLAWPAKQVLLAHGAPVVKDAKGYLVRTFRWLIV